MDFRILTTPLTYLSKRWFNAQFRTRLVFMTSFLVFATVCGFLFFAVWSFRQDKLAYIYEMNHIRARGLMLSAQVLLHDNSGSAPETITDRSQKALDALSLPRWPEAGEVFVGMREGGPFLLGRNADGGFWSKAWPKGMVPWGSGEHLAYWMTSFGKFLGTNRPSIVNAKDISKRAAVADFLRSTLVQGLVTVEERGGSVIAAYREVPGTNVNVFVETSVSEALAPMRRFLIVGIFAGIVLVLIAVFVAVELVRGLTEPLRNALEITTAIANGRYTFFVEHRYNDEIRQLFIHLAMMANKLMKREEGLKKLKGNLEQILLGTREMASAQDRFVASRVAIACIIPNIQVTLDCSAWLYLTKKPSEETVSGDQPFIGVQLFAEGNPIASALQPKETTLQNPNLPFEVGKSFLASQGFVLVPIVRGPHKIGVLVIDHYRHPVLVDEDSTFLDTLSQSLSVSLENIAYVDQVKQKTVIETEFGSSRSVQESLLPLCTEYPGTMIAADYEPAAAAGGDWYGHSYVPEEGFAYFYLGDVTGHGIPAALMTGVAYGAVHATERATREMEDRVALSPEERLRAMAGHVNEVLADAGRGNLVMTMVFLALEVSTGALFVLNAGQTSPLWVQKKEKKVRPIMGAGPILGTVRDPVFRVEKVKLGPGDSIFLYTDGLIENSDAQGQILKKRNLTEILQREGTVQEVHGAVWARAREIWNNFPAKDDITSILFRWKGPPSSPDGAESVPQALAAPTPVPSASASEPSPPSTEAQKKSEFDSTEKEDTTKTMDMEAHRP